MTPGAAVVPDTEQAAARGSHTHGVLDALRIEHRMVRELFDAYFRSTDTAVRREQGSHLLLLLELHASAEEGVFYPRVQQAAPGLVLRCEQEHEQARRIIAMLKPMDEGDRQAEQLFRQLADVVLTHIEDEEQRLFPQIALAAAGPGPLDLAAIGREMQTLELRMAAARRRPPPVCLRQ